jgi:antitoxin component YwqK of YwqJK toxin-antitoxin module
MLHHGHTCFLFTLPAGKKNVCMRLLLLLFLLTAASPAYSGDTAIRYLDAFLSITTNKKEALYRAAVTKTGKGWYAQVFHIDGTPAFTGSFRNKNLTMRHGWFRFFHAGNGRLMSEGLYQYDVVQGPWQNWYESGVKKDSGRLFYGRQTGGWKYWHPNGVLKQTGVYAENHDLKKIDVGAYNQEGKAAEIFFQLRGKKELKTGVWKNWHENGRLKDSVNYEQGLRNGIAKSWFANGQLESAGVYYNDQPLQTWQWFYPNGNLCSEEIYETGGLKKIKCFDVNGRYTGDSCRQLQPPVFPVNGGLEMYVRKNFVYPPEDKARQVKGPVRVQFTITTLGQPEKISFYESPSAGFTKEFSRLLLAMPAWQPAVAKGRVVAYTVKLVIPHIEYDGSSDAAIFLSRPPGGN